MQKLFDRPTRGGKLTILNCGLWGVVAIGLAFRLPLLLVPILFISWPVAWLPVLVINSLTGDGLVIASVVIGINSLLWGYGLSWLLSLLGIRERGGPESPRRGFEVVRAPPATFTTDPRASLGEGDPGAGTTVGGTDRGTRLE